MTFRRERKLPSSGYLVAAGVSIGMFVSARANALQPLSEFLAAAENYNLDNREAFYSAREQAYQAKVSLGRVLPVFTAQGIYTRNQYPASFDVTLVEGEPPVNLTIFPGNQLDAYLTLKSPIIDVAGWTRYRSADANAEAYKLDAKVTFLNVQKQVANNYYQLVGAEAVRRSSQRKYEVSLENAKLVEVRKQEGIASELDVERANSDVESAKQNIASAELSAELAQRALRTLTGITATLVGKIEEDDLHEETPLAGWEDAAAKTSPSIMKARFQSKMADLDKLVARLAFAPTVTAQMQERITNATGFTGKSAFYTFTLTLDWKLDYTSIATAQAKASSEAAVKTRETRAQLTARDNVHDAWFQIRANIAKSRAARAEAKTSKHAADLAHDRYVSGTATQLEVIQADRDSFVADVSRVQADADLAYARALLRINAGRPITNPSDLESTPEADK